MHLYEMVGVADQNGKTYVSKYGTYSKKDGFILNPTYYGFDKLLNNLVHEDCWKLKVDKKKMTQDEIEKILGYEIEIINGNKQEDKEYVRYENFDDFLGYLFGTDNSK